MDIAVSKANAKMTDYVGKLMIQVYNDGKRLNLSANSWPSRFVSSEASSAFSSSAESQAKGIVANDLNLQYVNPPGHLEWEKLLHPNISTVVPAILSVRSTIFSAIPAIASVTPAFFKATPAIPSSPSS